MITLLPSGEKFTIVLSFHHTQHLTVSFPHDDGRTHVPPELAADATDALHETTEFLSLL